MHPLQNGSQVTDRPARKERVGTAGYFSESNDSGAPSYPGQDWFNDIIDEFKNALAAAGVTYDPERLDHLKKIMDASGIQALKYRVGQKAEIHSAQIPDWLLKADGSIVSRAVDDVLWAHAENSGLVISQATKDANPEQYAMYYGDGDGATTFSLPNWYLGHFARGNPAGVALGATLGDAIRNITGGTRSAYASNVVSNGALSLEIYGNSPAKLGTIGADPGANYTISLDASKVVPTANENRPKAGHINICIERGKIPA